MNRLIIIIAIALLPAIVIAQKTKEPWTGKDKTAHYTMSITGALFLTTMYEQLEVKNPYIKAAGTMLLIGIGKEIIFDGLLKKGNCSGKDMAWDAAGCATALVMVKIPIEITKRKGSGNERK